MSEGTLVAGFWATYFHTFVRLDISSSGTWEESLSNHHDFLKRVAK